jgi:hypothetical protein
MRVASARYKGYLIEIVTMNLTLYKEYILIKFYLEEWKKFHQCVFVDNNGFQYDIFIGVCDVHWAYSPPITLSYSSCPSPVPFLLSTFLTLNFHIWEKTCEICLSEYGLFYLTDDVQLHPSFCINLQSKVWIGDVQKMIATVSFFLLFVFIRIWTFRFKWFSNLSLQAAEIYQDEPTCLVITFM